MALWHYKYYLIPLNNIIEPEKGDTAIVLPEYQANGLIHFNENQEFKNYFENNQAILSNITKEAKQTLTPQETWDSDAVCFGDKHQNSITIWSDDIECKLDLRFDYFDFIQITVDWAIRYQCAIVISGTGQVIKPSMDKLLNEISHSNAKKFLDKPIEFLQNRQ